MIEFSVFILGGCIGWGIALFMAGAFGVDDQVYIKEGCEDEY
jgi:hypothetical protein